MKFIRLIITLSRKQQKKHPVTDSNFPSQIFKVGIP